MDGAIGVEESRPSSNRGSKNYSLEIDGFKSVDTSGAHPAIGIYLRQEGGTFLYQCVDPSHPEYSAIRTWLLGEWVGASREMMRVEVPVADFRAVWPGSPLWSIAEPSN
jgi:hypothetical protein